MSEMFKKVALMVIMSLIFIGFNHLMGFENTVCFGIAVIIINCSKE